MTAEKGSEEFKTGEGIGYQQTELSNKEEKMEPQGAMSMCQHLCDMCCKPAHFWLWKHCQRSKKELLGAVETSSRLMSKNPPPKNGKFHIFTCLISVEEVT